MHQEPLHKSRPGVLGWMGAALSAVLIVYILLGSVGISEYLRKEIRTQRIKLALDGSNTRLAREHLSYALGAEGVAAWLSYGNHSSSPLGELMLQIFESFELSEASDFRMMLKRMEVIKSGVLTVREMAPYRVEYERLIRETKPTIESLIFLNDTKITKTKEREKLASEHRKLLQGFNLVASEFGDLFSLSPEPSAEDKPLNLYQSGVLKGLPRLRNLEDSVSSLATLAKALERARGRVQVDEGINAHKQFKDKMDYFHASITPMTRQSREILTRIRGLDDFLASNSAEMKSARNQVNGSIRKIFFEGLNITRKPEHLLLAMLAEQIQSNFF